MNKLKDLRLTFGYSYQDMADKLEISKTFYFQLENRQRRLLYERAFKIAKIFDLKPDDLFFEYETTKKD